MRMHVKDEALVTTEDGCRYEKRGEFQEVRTISKGVRNHFRVCNRGDDRSMLSFSGIQIARLGQNELELQAGAT